MAVFIYTQSFCQKSAAEKNFIFQFIADAQSEYCTKVSGLVYM